MATLWIAFLIAALIVLYLLRPFYRPFVHSAARFFEPNSTDQPRFRLNLQAVIQSRLFWLQLMALMLILLAMLIIDQTFADNDTDEQSSIGVWVVIDTSGSMTTIQDSEPRFERIDGVLDELVAHLEAEAAENPDVSVCARLSAVDLEHRVISPLIGLDELPEAAPQPRPLGTDASLIRGIQALAGNNDASTPCLTTHLFVVSDVPAPEWVTDTDQSVPVIWNNIAASIQNIGIADARLTNSNGLGREASVSVVLQAYITAPTESRLQVRDASGGVIFDDGVTWETSTERVLSFPVSSSGEYTLQVLPDDAYMLDNTATIEVDVVEQLTVDWQLADRSLLALLRWQSTIVEPDLRITSYPLQVGDSEDVPTLLVGNGYNQQTVETSIHYFDERNALLDGLRLEVIEEVGVQPIALDPAIGLLPLLTDRDGRAWLAINESPRQVYIPGLPSFTDENLSNFSLTLFFNAIRWLMDRPAPPLYTTTTIENPQPDGTRNALHPDEGNTLRSGGSVGFVSDISAQRTPPDARPYWSIVLALTVMVVWIERTLTLFGRLR